MSKIRIVIVEDLQLLREMFVEMFAGNEKIEIVGEAETEQEAVEIVSTQKPDIVLLDINLKQGSGFDALPHLRKISPGSRIIVLTMHNQPAYARKMFQLGASGYMTKNSSVDEMLKAIDEVMQNREYVCEEIKYTLSKQMLNSKPQGPDISALSLREIEIVKLMKDGFSSKDISAALHIGIRTVEVHRYNILKKLKLKNTASLVNYISQTDLNFL